MNCQQCEQPITPRFDRGHAHCKSCNVYRFPYALAASTEPIVASGKSLPFECPRCFTGLEVGKLHGQTEVCFCNGCRGFVIDNDSLRGLVHELRANYEGQDGQPTPMDPSELDQQTTCPTCLHVMEAHPYHGPGNVVINSCRSCEITWMDHGELSVIERAPGQRPESGTSWNAPAPFEPPKDPVAQALSLDTLIQGLGGAL